MSGRPTTVTSVPTAADDAAAAPRRGRGEHTRQLILETALRLFRERGYAETTMRAIAREAGVAVGNAYYYFDSKEHLIQGFYDGNQQAHRAAADPVLRDETDFAARLRGVLPAFNRLSQHRVVGAIVGVRRGLRLESSSRVFSGACC